METGRNEQTREHVEANAGESIMIWHWAHALLAFRMHGNDPPSHEAAAVALRHSAVVGKFLLRDEPVEEESDHFTVGSEDEAVSCANTLRDAWTNTPGAVDWLKARMKERRAAHRESRAGTFAGTVWTCAWYFRDPGWSGPAFRDRQRGPRRPGWRSAPRAARPSPGKARHHGVVGERERTLPQILEASFSALDAGVRPPSS